MTSKQMWTNLSTVLTNIAKEHFQDQDDVDAFMTRWNEHRNEVTKLFSGEKSTKRKKKDPNHPTRPLSSYMYYCKDHRNEALKTLPENSPTTEVSKKLGEMWRSLPAKKKVKYEKQAQKDKERYQAEMANYEPPEDLGEEEVTTGSKRKKDPNAPKRAMSAYMFFAQKERPLVKSENEGISFVETTKELGRRWKALTDEEKRPYEEMNARDKERYEREKTAYDAGETVTEANTEAKTQTKGKKSVVEKDSVKANKASSKTSTKTTTAKAKPIKKTPGYELYVNEQRNQIEEEHPEWNARRVTAEVNKSWRELEEEDRQNYEDEAVNQSNDSEDEELESEDSENELAEEET